MARVSGRKKPNKETEKGDSDISALFKSYLTALRKIPLDEKTEHTDRAALENLLSSPQRQGDD